MNIVIEAGRLTRDPEISYSSGQNGQFCVARYTLAVDGARNANGEQHTDFIKCVAFGRTAEFAEKHLHKGIKILINAHLSTGSYTNREGKKVYTTAVVVDSQELCESKRNSGKQDDYGNPPVSGGYDGNTSPTGSGYAGNNGYSGNSGYPQDIRGNQAGGYDPSNLGNNPNFMSIPDGIEEEMPFN